MAPKQKRPTKIEEITGAVHAAMELAAEARGLVKAYGTLFEALLNILKSKSVLSASDIKGVFYVAAAMIDELQPQHDIQVAAQAEMRGLIERIASNFGIEVPPPGQTGVQRTH